MAKRLSRLGRLRRDKASRDKRLPTTPTEGRPASLDLMPDDLKEIARLVGTNNPSDLRMLKRVLDLKRQFPTGSVPELITYDWLRNEGHTFVYQGSAYGGRRFKGGIVADFVVAQGGFGDVWMVNGDYWHSRQGDEEKDLQAKLRLKGQFIEGLRVRNITILWESTIYAKRPEVYQAAMAGIELGKS